MREPSLSKNRGVIRRVGFDTKDYWEMVDDGNGEQ
jgi:hypothetical protein